MLKSKESKKQDKKPAQASSRKGCMKGKGGPENASCTYKGVRQRTWGKWVAEIREPNRGNRIWLGTFNTAREAAMAYDATARRLYGANARVNLPDDESGFFDLKQSPLQPAENHRQAVAMDADGAADEASYSYVLHQMKMQQMQMYMMQQQQQHQQSSVDSIRKHYYLCRDVKIELDEKVDENEMVTEHLKAKLPEFDDSRMWVEAAATIDYHSQAMGDPGIAASTFGDGIGIELNHPLV